MHLHAALRVAAFAALALAATADAQQQPPAVARVGFLGVDRVAQGPRVQALVDGLRARGYVEGRNLVIEYRWADGRFDRLPALADELVQARVDVIVTASIPQSMDAARKATRTIPIVIPNMNDPEGTGLVASLSRPGGNVTGMAFQDTQVGVKRLDLFRQLVPGMKRLAIVQQRGSGSGEAALQSFADTTRAMGLDVLVIEVATPPDFAGAVAKAKAWGAQGVFQAPAFYVTEHRRQFMAELAKARLPSACEGRHYVLDGCLMSYNGSFEAVFRDSAKYVDRILRGAAPADLPVEQAREFEFVIGQGTAKALGIEIPPLLRVQATEILP